MDSLETQINNHAVFSVDKEKDEELYEIEERKLLEILMGYLKQRKNFREFGWVFFEKAKDCLKHYKKEKEKPFLNYFEVALKKELHKEQSKEWKEKANRLEFLEDKYKQVSRMDKNIDYKIYLKLIEREFQNCQDRQKPILRDLLTIHFTNEGVDLNYKYEFINEEILNLEDENQPDEKEIAEKYGVKKESASRTKMDFLEKVKKKIVPERILNELYGISKSKKTVKKTRKELLR
jgi:hypothetical protein